MHPVQGFDLTTHRTEDTGFESHQGVRFLGIYTLQ
jgi:hypothetical protein